MVNLYVGITDFDWFRFLSALPGITNTRTLIAFQAYSRHDLEAMWDLGAE